MMASLGKTSISRLQTCHKDLQSIVLAVAATEQILVVCGARTKEEQAELFKKGLTKTLNSKHLVNEKSPLSRAIDIAPYPVDWNNIASFYALSEKVLLKAKELGIKIRFGGDWNMDGSYKDNKFNDLLHYELMSYEEMHEMRN